MASFGFAGGTSSPYFGGGGIWGSDWGKPVASGIATGFEVGQMLRTMQNQNAIDPFAIPAIQQQADATRLGAANQAMMEQVGLDSLIRGLKKQLEQQQQAQDQGPGQNSTVIAANQQAMQDQQFDQLASPMLQRALSGGNQYGGMNSLLRMPQYQMQMPGFDGGGFFSGN